MTSGRNATYNQLNTVKLVRLDSFTAAACRGLTVLHVVTGAEQKFNQDLVSIQCGAEKVGERLLRFGLADLVVIHVFGALLSPGAGVWEVAWYRESESVNASGRS